MDNIELLEEGIRNAIVSGDVSPSEILTMVAEVCDEMAEGSIEDCLGQVDPEDWGRSADAIHKCSLKIPV